MEEIMQIKRSSFKLIKICLIIIATMFVTVGCGKTVDVESPIETNMEYEDDSVDTMGYEDGTYEIEVFLEGGSGKATILSPAKLEVKDGEYTLCVVWSSKYYDYMIVDGIRYDRLNTEEESDENSYFNIPIDDISEQILVIADTTAMSEPHEIEYTIHFDDSFTKEASGNVQITCEDRDGIKLSYSDIIFDSELELKFATQFWAKESEQGFKYVHIEGDRDYLLIPEGYTIPDDVPADIACIYLPLNNIYVVSTSAMDYFLAIDGLEYVGMCGTDSKDWYIEEIKEAIESDDILYAGKYSAPDFELLVSKNCSLAIENTMITHSPDIKEQLENLGIPVMVEHSSYESHPIARMEWIKFYGLLSGKEDVAASVFDDEVKKIEEISEDSSYKPSIAFFYVSSSGAVNVRKSTDYVPKMIEMAGGIYALDKKTGDEDNNLSTINMQMEAFYEAAHDADILIYNSTIDAEITSIDELTKKSILFEDFKAVKNGNVYCCGKNLFQESMNIGRLIKDINLIISDGDVSDEELYFLHRVN